MTGAPRVLLVTSAVAGEGKSTTALMLARNFAQLGRRVLLIDADLRKPSLHTRLNVSPTNAGSANTWPARPGSSLPQPAPWPRTSTW